MSRKVAGKVYHQRQCAYCRGGIADVRPVFVVAQTDGRILGPFHAGCAAKLVEQAKRGAEWGPMEAENLGQIVPKAREETLPW